MWGGLETLVSVFGEAVWHVLSSGFFSSTSGGGRGQGPLGFLATRYRYFLH